jgi:spermidine/putrescine transport system permease protein
VTAAERAPVEVEALLGPPPRERRLRSPLAWWRDPWRKPHILAAATWLYLLWALLPVVIAIQFSFNKGKSRSTWQGFSWRWYWQDPNLSVLHDPTLHRAVYNSLWLAVMTMLICAPLGVALAIGLTRWRGYGQRPANFLQLIPLVTPEIVIGSSLFLFFTTLVHFVHLGRGAQLVGQITYNLSTVIVIVRGRLLTIGRDYEDAAQDLGASPMQSLRTVILPLLGPAIFASLMIVFATVIDDFVISQFLSADASSETVPMKIYSSLRATATPAVNALATLMLLFTLTAVLLAVFIPRLFRRGERGSAVEDFALEM